MVNRHAAWVFFLLPVLLLAACPPAAQAPPDLPPSPPPSPADGPMAETCQWSIEPWGEGAEEPEATGRGEEKVRVAPDPGMGPGVVAWRGELDGNDTADLLVRFPEGCGNYGECPYALYVACDGGGFREVWAPDYAMEIKIGEPGADGWREVLRVEREGDRATEKTIPIKKDQMGHS